MNDSFLQIGCKLLVLACMYSWHSARSNWEVANARVETKMRRKVVVMMGGLDVCQCDFRIPMRCTGVDHDECISG
jgi:hypothetical protein